MTAPSLDQRSRDILIAVIGEYVRTAQPVGSRIIARKHMRGLSPATIRNAMADLEEMGYLSQPHTSAGRVPTDKAYRFYVDHLERVPWMAGTAEAPRESLSARRDPAEQVMSHASLHLSERTHMTGVLLAPPLHHTALDRIELIVLGEDRALAVVVTETGWVTARPLSVTPRLA